MNAFSLLDQLLSREASTLTWLTEVSRLYMKQIVTEYVNGNIIRRFVVSVWSKLG